MNFYFYDLETTGVNPRDARIMQFAGRRTDSSLNPIGDPHNFLIKITPDIIPDPDAVLTHGITPQQTLTEGISEAEFLKIFSSEISIPNTVFAGFNNIRFDDEFMRYTLWRNFYDSYEWQWMDGSSRWDILDLVRITRALRPEGIVWPKVDAGNRLEALAKLNKLKHANAHDALSDVDALIELTKLIKSKQPRLFKYQLDQRDKKVLQEKIGRGTPFLYTSGRYPKETLHTSAAVAVAEHPTKNSIFVYDLRIDPAPYINMSEEELVGQWQLRGKDAPYFPVKELAFNRCPAVAPMEVFDKVTQQRLNLDYDVVKAHLAKLKSSTDFGKRLSASWQLAYPQLKPNEPSSLSVDSQLYDGFIKGGDKTKIRAMRVADPKDINQIAEQFEDKRLKLLAPLYKARNFPSSLNQNETVEWNNFCKSRLLDGGQASRIAKVFKRIAELENRANKNDRYLLEELSLYAQSIVEIE